MQGKGLPLCVNAFLLLSSSLPLLSAAVQGGRGGGTPLVPSAAALLALELKKKPFLKKKSRGREANP